MKGKRRLWDKLKLLHPKNLEKEVHIYGYHFSWKSHVTLMAASLIGISAVGMLFQLEPVYFGVVAAAVILALPVLVLDLYKKMYEQKRFSDAVSYMEQMLYAFQKNGKVVQALKESRGIFDDGQMRRCMDAAIWHMEQGMPQTEAGVLRESLGMIEEHYECVKLTMVHNLLIHAEEYGGNVLDSVTLALEDLERWKKRGYRLQAEKKKFHTDNLISIVVATLLCAIALYVLQEMQGMFAAGTGVQIFQLPVIQLSSMLFVLLLLRIFVKSARNLTDNWLSEETLHEDSYITHSYDMVVNYDEGKGRNKRVLLAIGLLAAAVACLAYGKRIAGLFCLPAAVFCLIRPKVICHLAKKDVTEEMYLVLPQWLMGLALLLQNNNVQVALTKSYAGVPAVLKKELAMLLARLEQEPGRLQSYTLFCANFDLPEVTSCMKMLHAFSENGTGNVGSQMNHLLERVAQMQDMADEIRNESTAFRMKLIFSYPVVAATVKLLADLSVGMVVMLQMLGSAGGI